MGVVAALESEARTLGSALRRRDGLSALADGALLLVSGMGSARAGSAARRLVEAGASSLVSFGLAGGLDPALSAGAIVLPTEVISSSGARFATSPVWREQLRGTLAQALTRQRPAVSGILLSNEAAIDSVAHKAAAFRDSGAVAVDMESFAVAAAAAAHGVPFIAVRVIVDTAADPLPAAVIAAGRGGEVSLTRLIGGLAAAPWELPALIRLAQRHRTATRSLAAVARAGLLTPRDELRPA